jgi:N-carbamoyl-L-amino-acid hydrolase
VVQVIPDRLLKDIRDLSEIGKYKTGVHRPTFSEADMEARNWLKGRLQDAGLDVRIDGIGNVIGYSPASRRVLVGSHIESQPHAGRLDGALGVLFGIELARAFRDAGTEVGVDVGAWADEEGYFGTKLGSRSFCDGLTDAEVAAARHRDDGTPLTTVLERVGLGGLPRERIDFGNYVAYCEAHIEQGAWLDSKNLSIGVVTAIVGQWIYKIKATGEQNHAGSTQMPDRKDAGLALCRLAVAINDEFPEVAAGKSVWTVGRLEMVPGVYTIIPGLAKMDFQFRDTDPAVLQRMHDRLDAIISRLNEAGPCKIEYTVQKGIPAPMAPHIRAKMVEAASELAPGLYTEMHSASGHDASVFSFKMPAGMIFVPSIKGISHHYDEDTKEADMVLGCKVFAEAVSRILNA